MSSRTFFFRMPWIDSILVLGLAALLWGLFGVGQEWFGNLALPAVVWAN